MECIAKLARSCRHPRVIERALEAKLGDLSVYQRRATYVGMTLDEGNVQLSSGTLRVVSLDDGSLEVDGRRVGIPLPPTSGGPILAVHYTFRLDETVEHMLTTMARIDEAYGARFAPHDLESLVAFASP